MEHHTIIVRLFYHNNIVGLIDIIMKVQNDQWVDSTELQQNVYKQN